MNDFFNSKLVTDLQNGILPPVTVSIEQQSLNLTLFKVFVVVTVIMAVGFSFYKFSK